MWLSYLIVEIAAKPLMHTKLLLWEHQAVIMPELQPYRHKSTRGLVANEIAIEAKISHTHKLSKKVM